MLFLPTLTYSYHRYFLILFRLIHLINGSIFNSTFQPNSMLSEQNGRYFFNLFRIKEHQENHSESAQKNKTRHKKSNFSQILQKRSETGQNNLKKKLIKEISINCSRLKEKLEKEPLLQSILPKAQSIKKWLLSKHFLKKSNTQEIKEDKAQKMRLK